MLVAYLIFQSGNSTLIISVPVYSVYACAGAYCGGQCQMSLSFANI